MSFVDRLATVMNYSVRKREVISNNIANLMTPNYKAQVLKWNDEFKKQLDLLTTNEKHISLNAEEKNYVIERDYETKVNSDGNNVDLNREFTEMLKNNQLFSMTINVLNKYYESMGAARGR